jgi:hypothetical protein
MDVSDQLHVPASLPTDKFYLVPISYATEIFGVEKNSRHLLGIEPRFIGSPTRNLRPVPTQIFQLYSHKRKTNKSTSLMELLSLFFPWRNSPPVGQGLLIMEDS